MQLGRKFCSYCSKGSNRMPRLPLVISLLTLRALFGQSIPVDLQNPSPNSVVQLKRTPASPAATPQKTDTFVDHFDFGANVRALAQSMETPVATGATPAATHGPAAVPEGYRPVTDVVLSPTAQQAVGVQCLLAGTTERSRARPGRPGVVRFRSGLADRGVRTVARLPDRTAARRKTRRRAANWRFGPVERGPRDIWQRRGEHRHARAETANAGPRYEPFNHDRSPRLLRSARFQSERLRLASGVCLQRRRRRKKMEGSFCRTEASRTGGCPRF